MRQPRRPARSGNSATLLALFVLMMLSVAFLALTAMIMPAAFGFLAVLLGLFLFVSLHYLLWGWWLGKPGSETDVPPLHDNDEAGSETGSRSRFQD